MFIRFGCRLTSLSLIFLYLGSGVHRDLHSFPTRRSSDLSIDAVDLIIKLKEITGRRIQPEAFKQVRTDRKSTRLNSSHANISYAVFCLKKKKDYLSIYIEEVDQQVGCNIRPPKKTAFARP